MSVIDSLAVLITLTALFSYANYKFIKLPTTIGVMVIALVASLVMIGIGRTNPAIAAAAQQFLRKIDFSDALMQGMLSFLLFAGALHIDLTELSREKLPVAALAIFGVAISTFVFGAAIFYALRWVGQPISFPVGALVRRAYFADRPDRGLGNFKERASLKRT